MVIWGFILLRSGLGKHQQCCYFDSDYSLQVPYYLFGILLNNSSESSVLQRTYTYMYHFQE